MRDELRELAIELYDIGAIKFGKFITKSGLESPIYIDFRVIINYPDLLLKLSKKLWGLVENSSQYSHLCGVPYTALPIATVICMQYKIPMLIRRKESKSYGTKKMIEGIFKPGDTPIIIEDLITSGSSILETVTDLEKEKLQVNTAIIIMDREQGGKVNLENNGIHVKSLFKLSEYLNILLEEKRIDETCLKHVSEYICSTPATLNKDTTSIRLLKDFSTREELSKNAMAKKLFNLMIHKQTTICLAADFTISNEILKIAELAGPHIAVLKIHVDILEDFSETFIAKLKKLADRFSFLIMEDRKFGDIGHIVCQQFSKGFYKISEWADMITVHILPGKGIIEGIQQCSNKDLKDRGIFVVAEMSSEGSLTCGDYVQNAVKIAENYESITGFVCQKNIFTDPGLIQLTPGVQLIKSKDDLGQQYNTPEDVVNSGADLVVVGRGITQSSDPLSTLLEYKKVLWQAYKKRINS